MSAKKSIAQKGSRALWEFLANRSGVFLPTTGEGSQEIEGIAAVVQHMPPDIIPTETDPTHWTVRRAITCRRLFEAACSKKQKFRGAFEVRF